MKSFTINMLAAGLIAMTGCANINSAFVDANAVCHDKWYGYSQTTCQPSAPPYGVADAERDIADLKELVRSLKDDLAAAKQLIVHLTESQTSLQSQINHVTNDTHMLKTQQ